MSTVAANQDELTAQLKAMQAQLDALQKRLEAIEAAGYLTEQTLAEGIRRGDSRLCAGLL